MRINDEKGGVGALAVKRFSSLTRYNAAYPHAALPPSPGERDALRRFDAAGIGVDDDVSGSGALLTIDFLPGGAPQGPGIVAFHEVRTSVRAWSGCLAWWP